MECAAQQGGASWLATNGQDQVVAGYRQGGLESFDRPGGGSQTAGNRPGSLKQDVASCSEVREGDKIKIGEVQT